MPFRIDADDFPLIISELIPPFSSEELLAYQEQVQSYLRRSEKEDAPMVTIYLTRWKILFSPNAAALNDWIRIIKPRWRKLSCGHIEVTSSPLMRWLNTLFYRVEGMQSWATSVKSLDEAYREAAVLFRENGREPPVGLRARLQSAPSDSRVGGEKTSVGIPLDL